MRRDRWAIAVGRDARAGGRTARRAFADRGIDARMLPPGSATDLAAQVVGAHDSGEAIAVVGGDGTLNLVVDSLLRHGPSERPTLGVIPAGTGSDFARMFAIPTQVSEAVAKALSGEDYVTDAIRLSGSFGERYGINVLEAGLGAATVRVADRLPRWLGPIKYELAFWVALPTFRPGSFRLETDRRVIEGKGLVIVAANGEFFGGGMQIAPKASLVDGAFDMIVIDAPRRAAFTLFPRMKQGLHLDHDGVRRVTTSWFRLETSPAWPSEIDGEYLGATDIEGRILPGALHVRV